MTARYCTADSCQNPRVPMPPDDNSRACAACWGRLEQQLAEMPALVDELNTTISRQTATGLRNGPRGNEKPLAYDANASEAMEVLFQSLWGWLREAIEDHPAYQPVIVQGPARDGDSWPVSMSGRPAPSVSVSAFSRELLCLLGWLQRHEDGQLAIDEINAASTNAWRRIDSPPEQRSLGPCLAPTEEGQVCPDPLWYRDGDKKTKCIRCDTEWDVRERRAAMVDMLSETAGDVREVIVAAGHVGLYVTQQQISRWKRTNRLVPRSHDPERYSIDEVLTLAVAHQRRLDRP